MVTSRNPLVRPQPVAVRPFTALRDLAPPCVGALMLRVNGEWLLRRDWGRLVAPGDVVEWYELPQGGNTSRTVFSLVLLATAIIAGPALGAWVGASLGFGLTAAQATALGSALIGIGGNLLGNALLPMPRQDTGQGGSIASPGSVYNVAAAANQARLYQPIPVIYGKQATSPDYAAPPYVEYRGGDQYFFAVYCIGQGEYAIGPDDVQIDDTPLSHFSDVTWRVRQPGWVPAFAPPGATVTVDQRLVHPAVVTSVEVAGQALKPSVFVGGFSACGPGKRARSIGLDVLFDRLGRANDDGSLAPVSVTVAADWRPIDDYGTAVGPWTRLVQRTFTAATTTPQRYTISTPLASPSRVEVRMTRIGDRDDSSRVFNDPVWGGMRAYLDADAPLCATATHLEVVIRASEQLSGLSQRKIKAIVQRKLPKWSPGGGYTAPVETRNPAWALLDVWRNPVYGDGLPDARIDLQTLYDLAQVWDARQDRCDIVFDSRTTSWEAARIIARTGRAVPFRRMGVNTLARDQRQTLPVTAYTTRNMLPGASVGYSLPTEETADGVVAEYFDGRAQEWREVTCPAPGVTAPARPVRVRYLGITGRTHAEREGLYEAAQNLWRRKFPRWQTELEGMLPAFGALVVCAPPMATLIQAGDVVDWDDTALVLTLTEPPRFMPGVSHFIALHRDDGSITAPIAVTPGPTANDVRLAALPDFGLSWGDPHRERTRYYFGTSEGHRTYTRVVGIRRQGRGADGAETIELSGVVEDDRIHDVDAHLLPAPGVVQDVVRTSAREIIYIGIGPGTSTQTGLSLPVAQAAPGVVHFTDLSIYSSEPTAGNAQVRITLRRDGSLQTATPATGTQTVAGQWLEGAPVEPATAALYEVRASVLSAERVYAWSESPEPYAAPPQGDPLDTWLRLDSDRSWAYIADPFYATRVTLRMEVRESASGLVQAAPSVQIVASNLPA